MRLHIVLNDELVAELDARVGRGGRSRFVVKAVRRRLADERRWDSLLAAAGSIEDGGRDWDADPAGWVAEQRCREGLRIG